MNNILVERLIAFRMHLWNALIPKRARNVEVLPSGDVRYLHPTKGFRFVSAKRLGLA